MPQIKQLAEAIGCLRLFRQVREPTATMSAIHRIALS